MKSFMQISRFGSPLLLQLTPMMFLKSMKSAAWIAHSSLRLLLLVKLGLMQASTALILSALALL
jgi:hypothetical protein